MSRQIYVNLAVKDLQKSVAFFTALGFTFNPQFTDDTATCMIIDENHSGVMLLTHAKFNGFAPKGIADTAKGNEALICLSCESRAEVDELVKKAVAAGGHAYSPPQDHGFMYGHNFADLDGHCWELIHMDLSAMPKAN